MASQDWFDKDFYALLGVSKDAAAARSRRPTASWPRTCTRTATPATRPRSCKFKEVGEAYSVLSDPEQRKQYDAIRSMTHGGARFTSGGRAGPGPGGFEDVFSTMFGGGGPGRRARVRSRPVAPAGAGGPEPCEDLLAGMFGGGAGAGAYGGYGAFGAPADPQRGADVEARRPGSASARR